MKYVLIHTNLKNVDSNRECLPNIKFDGQNI